MTSASRRYKIAVGLLWLAILAGGGIWAYTQNISAAEIIAWVSNNARSHIWAPVACIILYAIRPLTLMPAMLITIACGSLFGFWPGLLWGLIGENISANTAYALARFFRSAPAGHAHGEPGKELSRFRRTLRENTVATVIILRAVYLPFDLVNFGCGFLRVPWGPYLVGSLIGMLPPMVTYVSFGATVNFNYFAHHLDDFDTTKLFDWHQLVISLGLAAGSVVIALLAHRFRHRLGGGDQGKG